MPFFSKAAENSGIFINEISWMGAKIEGIDSKNWWRYEWLEIYNNNEAPAVLDGWKIELNRVSLDWALDLKGEVLGKSYFLVSASDKIPSFDLNYSNLSGKFVNSGQKVLLKNKEGEIADEVNCENGWFAGDNETKQTMEKKNSALPGNDPDNWQDSENSGGTPKAKNSATADFYKEPEIKTEPASETAFELPAQSNREEEETILEKAGTAIKENVYPGGIIFNEILPSPEGADEENEWIEIFNKNNFEIDLSGWKMSDANGKTINYIFPQGIKLGPKKFLVLKRPETKIVLNNDADGLRLFTPDGNLADSVNYEKASVGLSYNLTASDWMWSGSPSPGSENAIYSENITPAPGENLAASEKAADSATKNNLAQINESFPGNSNSFPILIFAAFLALFSGIIILVLRKVASK